MTLRTIRFDDDPAHTIEALNDQLQDQAIELDMLREALGVPYAPHQSLLERMLEAARGRAGSGAAPEPPAQPEVPMRDLLAEAREQVEALDRENHKMRRCVARLMARLTVWLDDDQFNEADGIMSPEFEPPAQEPGTAAEIEALRAEVGRLRADAERYRWLRAEHEPADLPIAQVVWKRGNDPHADWVNLVDGGDLDRHIDAAMEASNAG